MTMAFVSRQSVSIYGRGTPYYLSDHLYYDLRTAGASPSLYQIASLSRISGYRVRDWLRVFGFHLENIARAQIALREKRTILLDPSVDDSEAWVSTFILASSDTVALSTCTPLSQLLQRSDAVRLRSIAAATAHSLYVQIGERDTFSCPEVLPLSVVRFRLLGSKDASVKLGEDASRQLCLIENNGRLFCCRIRVLENGLVSPLSGSLYPGIELETPESKLLGIADLEIRSLARMPISDPATSGFLKLKGAALLPGSILGHNFLAARERMGYTLREVSSISRSVAYLLDDARYFVSSSSMSDFETRARAPRHIHKLITICILYGLRFFDLLQAAGIGIGSTGEEVMPDEFVGGRSEAPEKVRPVSAKSSEHWFTDLLSSRIGEIPFFLRESLDELSGLATLSLNDFFWIPPDEDPLHPALIDAVLVIVNRRKKKPSYVQTRPPWKQPIYLLRRRDGSYFCGCCELSEGDLIIHRYASDGHSRYRLRNRFEAEVIGELATIMRRLR
jgi:hypothetical protein